LGRAQTARGDYSGATDSFQRLLAAAEKAQNRSQMALARESLGFALEERQHYSEALEHFRKYLDLSADAEHIGYAASACGNSLWRLGRYAEAAAMFDKADASAGKFAALRISIASSRARMELSREHYAQAATLAGAALAADTSHSPATVAGLKTTIGLASFGAGKKAEGLRLCVEALSDSAKLGGAGTVLDARLALAQIRIEMGDRAGALAVLHDAEPSLAGHSESQWRALALMSRAGSEYAAPARQALDAMASQLGSEAFREYLTRPDVQRLSRPLLQPGSSNQ
jgi:tetratricopeptide (TPR) repeat protein